MTAKDKAIALSTSIDQDIGRALFIKEFDGNNNINRTSNIIIRGYSSKSNNIYGSRAATNLEFEKIKIEYSILCRFELK